MRHRYCGLVFLALSFFWAGCDRESSKAGALLKARGKFKSKIVSRAVSNDPVDAPPANLFQLVRYRSPVGELPAYLTVPAKDQAKHAAIIWITGGDCNSIGDVWSAQDPRNDQSASAFRKAGIVMMFPSLRGGNGGPGKREGFYGEVDDVLAAAEFLAAQPQVDPQRIYLGGHSTGGTMALLVAAASPRFRAVFSLGPVSDVSHYPEDFLPFDLSNSREAELRSPGRWIESIQTPTFVLEGTDDRSNIDDLRQMASRSKNALVHFIPVAGASHFSIIDPVARAIPQKVLSDTGPSSNIAMSEAELARLFGR